MKNKIILSIILVLTISISSFGQANSFTWDPNDTINITLNPTGVQGMKMKQINTTNAPLTLGIRVIYNDIPSGWDGMLCVLGTCLGNIPVVGTQEDMDPAPVNDHGWVRLTINPMGISGQAMMRVKVYNLSDTTDYGIATWIMNVNSTVGINEYPTLQKLNPYPNPTQDFVSFEAAESFDGISLIDMSGRAVLNSIFDISKKKRIDISKVANGLYILQAIKNEKVIGYGKVRINK